MKDADDNKQSVKANSVLRPRAVLSSPGTLFIPPFMFVLVPIIKRGLCWMQNEFYIGIYIPAIRWIHITQEHCLNDFE